MKQFKDLTIGKKFKLGKLTLIKIQPSVSMGYCFNAICISTGKLFEIDSNYKIK
jgi:hypothetical protein